MKRSVLSMAIAATAITGTAHAFDPVATPPDYTITISGATASETTLADVLIADICASNIDKFNYTNKTHYAVACHVNNVAGKISGLPVAGRNILFLKNSGGSGTGAGALQNHVPVEVEDAVGRDSNAAAAIKCTGHTSPSVSGVTYTNNTGCADNLASKVPDWGISDVEPAIFVDDLAPPIEEGGPFDPSGPKLVVKPLSQLGFGVAVTTSFYRALQAAQFPLNNDCNPTTNGAGTDNNGNQIRDAYEASGSNAVPAGASHKFGDTAACMPSLSRWEIGQILKGSITSLSQLTVGSATLAASAAGKPWAPSGGNALNVCRRTTGSGTHAVTSMFFLGTQCSKSGRSMVTEDGDQVFANVSSGNMDACLSAFESGGTAPAALPIPVPAAAGTKRYAIGYNSVERNSNLAQGYRFIKVDGRAPSLTEMHDANYLETGAATMQTRSVGNVSGDYVQVPPSDTAGVTSMFNFTALQMSNPALISTLNNQVKFQHPFGNSGFLASPSAAQVADAVLNPARPVGTFKRQEGTSAQNSCLEPQVGVPNTGVVPVDNK